MAVFASRQIVVPSAGKQLGDYAVGESVFLNVNGTAREFLVVNQGVPSASILYDSSCDGTWLLMKDIYEFRQWHSSDVNDYENSTIHSYLNGTFLNLFDADIKAQFKTVKLPYRKGSGYGTTITSGASGLAAKIFLLSSAELNWFSRNSAYFPNSGDCLSYFSGCADTDSKRIAKLDGYGAPWWLRYPCCKSDSGSMYAFFVYEDGGWDYYNCSEPCGIRPALVLPYNTKFDPDTNQVKGVA